MTDKEEVKKISVPSTPIKTPRGDTLENKTIISTDDNRLNKIQWTSEIDRLLSTWADNAICYKWLHEESTYKYSKINFGFSIPIIILSTISGTLSVGLSGYVPPEYQSYGQAGIGAINIFAGLLTTLQNFFRPSNLSEAHRISALGWSKLYRNISNELRMKPSFRKEPNMFYKQCRAEFDRLIETHPVIPKDIINKFKKKFKKMSSLELPDVCDTLIHTEPYKEIENMISDAVNTAQNSNISMATILEEDPVETLNENEKGTDVEKILQNIENSGGTLEQVWTNEGKKWRIKRPSVQSLNIPNLPKTENQSNITSINQNKNIKEELNELMKKSVVKNLANKFKDENLMGKLLPSNVEEKKEEKDNEAKNEDENKVRDLIVSENKQEQNLDDIKININESNIDEQKSDDIDIEINIVDDKINNN
jgi:hypothetical protein